MTTIQQSMSNTLQLLEQHTENIIRSLAAEHGFDADEAIQKFITSSTSSVTIQKDKGKTKKIKAPNKPKNPNKKPLNSYFLFAQDNRPQVKLDNPDMKPQDITKHLKTLWDDLSDDDKLPYTEKANTAMAIYKKATAEWKLTLQ